jgi:S1-C subfamily serine protease
VVPCTRRILPGLGAAVAALATAAVAAALFVPAPAQASPAQAARTGAVSPTRGVVVIDTELAYQGGAATGTGMVIAANGVVLTNNHVIKGATTIRVVVPSARRSYKARVLGYSVGADVAVLKLVNASGLATVRLGSSSTVRRGHTVTAVGNAGGTGTLVTARGTVTALGRTITVRDDEGGTARLRGLIQIDAELQPGDSGGPLLDRGGRVIGIDTAASLGFSFQGAGSEGYAIPIDRALALARQIRAGRASATVHVGPTAFLGVSAQSVAGPGGGSGGVLVARVVAGGPADRAGIEPGDVITAVAGRSISSASALASLVLRKKPGDTLRITWVDAYGDETTVGVRLSSGPPQ